MWGKFKKVLSVAVCTCLFFNMTAFFPMKIFAEGSADTNDTQRMYENEYIPEAKDRVIISSDEKTETKMTEEMAELADELETPLAVYEYLYNNLNAEYYVGSRKGAIGAYEQRSANDVDSASLLTAMFRYLGYEASYVTGQVLLTEKQLLDVTASDSVEKAEKIYTLMGRTLEPTENGYATIRTWVKTVIDGVEYQLDVNFKEIEYATGISDELAARDPEIDIKDIVSVDDANAIFDRFAYEDTVTDVNLAGRKIVTSEITEFNTNLPYTCDNIMEETDNITESSVILSDSVAIAFGNSGVTVSSALAYLEPISIAYVPSSAFYDALDGIVEKPENIYAVSEDSYLLRNEKTISPALYLGNQKAYEWGSRVSVGDKQQMRIFTNTGGQERRYEETRELIVGSVVSLVIDTQVISPQSLLTCYKNYKKMKDSIDSDNFFETGYCDNYLNLIGNAYFTQLDIQNAIYASAYDIYKERDLSFGLFTYEPNVVTKSVGGYQTVTLEKEGHFGLDIIGLYNRTVSMAGSDSDVSSYLFVSGFAASYLEGKVLQQFTGIRSVSTAEVFRRCEKQGVKLKMLSSGNSNDIDGLQISAKDKENILKKTEEGYLVIVPERNISVSEWTGTAYLAQGSNGTDYRFIITGDKNGGYTTDDLSVYLTVSTIGSGVDMYSMIFGMVNIASFLIATPALDTVVTAAALLTVTVAFVGAIETWVTDYRETVDLYFRSIDGDTDAADVLNGKAFFASVSVLIDFPSAALEGKRGSDPDDIPTPGKRKEKFIEKGYESSIADSIFGMENVDYCSDDLLETIGQSAKPSDIVQMLSKYPDDVIEAVNKSVDKETVITLIAEHGDNITDVIVKYGDGAVVVITKSTNPDDVIQLLKSGTHNTLKALQSYGDDAVKALNSVSSSYRNTVSRHICKYGDAAVEVYFRFKNDAYNALKQCSDSHITQALEMMKSEEGIAVRYIRRNGDGGLDALKNYSEHRKQTGLKNGWDYVTEPLPDDFVCENAHLEGKTHPQTGVPFERRTVILGGKESEVVVPKFDSLYDAYIPDDLILKSDQIQFSECNAQLLESLEKDPGMESDFTAEQLEKIHSGKTPDGYTWHHDSETGKMQLVNYDIHRDTGHTGGRKIWGGGSDARSMV